jgi:hypothetical protein
VLASLATDDRTVAVFNDVGLEDIDLLLVMFDTIVRGRDDAAWAKLSNPSLEEMAYFWILMKLDRDTLKNIMQYSRHKCIGNFYYRSNAYTEKSHCVMKLQNICVTLPITESPSEFNKASCIYDIDSVISGSDAYNDIATFDASRYITTENTVTIPVKEGGFVDESHFNLDGFFISKTKK